MQVIKATAKSVVVRRIASNKREGTPRPNEFIENERPMTKRVNDGEIRLGGWTSAELWNGKPLDEWHPMFGKNYNLY